MSHYLGFGNMSVDNLNKTASQNNHIYGHEPSGKFKEKIMLKQRQIEEKMIENRIAKLMNEDARLKR